MPDFSHILDTIYSTPGVIRVVLLDTRGFIRGQAGEDNEKKLADYISFISVTSAQVRNYLSISLPHNARITLSDGQTLVILFGEELTAGILLQQDTEYLDIIDKYASAINELKLTK